MNGVTHINIKFNPYSLLLSPLSETRSQSPGEVHKSAFVATAFGFFCQGSFTVHSSQPGRREREYVDVYLGKRRIQSYRVNKKSGDFAGGPLVETLPSNAGSGG